MKAEEGAALLMTLVSDVARLGNPERCQKLAQGLKLLANEFELLREAGGDLDARMRHYFDQSAIGYGWLAECIRDGDLDAIEEGIAEAKKPSTSQAS